ncbi:TetR/AcrR family transcriptional regulator [Mycolicibacterium iranicum]|uniref:TetR family transcriptional regulator n=1 Tax=Mycolicibacterium iranicum TaxID=912594 RepID=A0A178LRW0_MYCIR|nr:TetR/AcrR family transcriptional regulator [Mycolicibacterium iranicum]OAN34590.1 TetR family transcriptional regulator [Mycolicibacterium iranicum]
MAASSGDPRPARSRARLLEAATALLRAGGPAAVTVDAVTRQANVARATLYRHFPSANDLVAASFASLISPPPMPPDEGSLRDRLLAVVVGWADAFADAPITLTAMAWVSLGPEMPRIPDSGSSPGVQTLRQRIAEEYSAPFTRILESPQAIAELEPVDLNTALALLIGPLAFGRISTLADFDYRTVATAAVDAFLTTYSRRPVSAASTEPEGA